LVGYVHTEAKKLLAHLRAHLKRDHTFQNKMTCELMLTYDTPAYMFNVY